MKPRHFDLQIDLENTYGPQALWLGGPYRECVGYPLGVSLPTLEAFEFAAIYFPANQLLRWELLKYGVR
jgi:hypothetical protein